jgi:hypothetical protein
MMNGVTCDRIYDTEKEVPPLPSFNAAFQWRDASKAVLSTVHSGKEA